MGLTTIPTLNIEFAQPAHLGEALRRAFVFCDMSAPG